jgi:protein-S-isoprenylcysteine O-methyltransferase Ste14
MSDRDSMTVTITLTQRDYAKALGAIQQQSPAKRILFWISIVFSVYMAYLLLRSSHGWLYATAGPVLLVVLIVGLGLLLRYWAARDFVRKNQDKLGPTQHEIGPD